MMLTYGQMMLRASTQMMLCPQDTNEKILRAELSGFFEGGISSFGLSSAATDPIKQEKGDPAAPDAEKRVEKIT